MQDNLFPYATSNIVGRSLAVVILLFIALLPAKAGWPSERYYTASVKASPTGAGTVYISKESTSTPDYDNNTPIGDSDFAVDTWFGLAYVPSKTVYLYAQANPGYIFSRWSDESTENPHTTTVFLRGTERSPSAYNYTAYFIQQTGRVKVEVATSDLGKGGVAISDPRNKNGDNVTITAKPDVANGVKFLGWTKDNGTTYVSQSPQYVISVNNTTAGTYYAHFSDAQQRVYCRLKNNKTGKFLTLYGNAAPSSHTRSFDVAGQHLEGIADGFIFTNSLKMVDEETAKGNPMTVFQRNGSPGSNTQGSTGYTYSVDLLSCENVNFKGLGGCENYELTMETTENGITTIYANYDSHYQSYTISKKSYLCDEGNGWAVMKTFGDATSEPSPGDEAKWTVYLLDSDCTEGSFGANTKQKYTKDGKYYTTMYAYFPYQLMDGVKAYYLPVNADDSYNAENHTVTFTEVPGGIVPAKTAVVLETAAPYNGINNRLLPLLPDPTGIPSLGSNILKGYHSLNGETITNTSKTAESGATDGDTPKMFILSMKNGVLGWYFSTSEIMTPNKAYIDIKYDDNPEAREFFNNLKFEFGHDDSDKEPTGIILPEFSNSDDGPLFDLNGRRVTNGNAYGLQKGVYIRNGKKIVIK